MSEPVRLDKYLWAIRVYKTRSEAAEACKGNKVKIGGVAAKPSRLIKEGEVIEVRKAAVAFTYKVLATTEHRLGPKFVAEFAQDLTPESERAKLLSPVEVFFVRREKGSGRPTKKERRELDFAMDSLDYDD